MEPAAKRAKVEITNFDQLNLDEFSIVQVGKTKKDLKFYGNISGKPIRANLTPTDWVSTRFGFDLACRFIEKPPSFLGGDAPKHPGFPESLVIKVAMNPAQKAFLQKLDETAQNAYSEIVPCKWQPLISDDYDNCKFRVVLAGDGLTKLTVVKDGKVLREEGYDFLKTFNSDFSRSDIKLVFRVKSVYVRGGKAGLTMDKPTAVAEEDVFGDDSSLL